MVPVDVNFVRLTPLYVIVLGSCTLSLSYALSNTTKHLFVPYVLKVVLTALAVA